MNTRDTFRTVNRGGVALEVNSRRQTSDCFVDRSRLRKNYSEEYEPSATPGKPGKWVGKTTQASVEDNARAAADAMKHRSSYVDESVEANSDRSAPSAYCYNGDGPLTKRRGDVS